MDSTPALRAAAHVPTEAARRYLGQLCKHFQHRLPVELEERHGRIAFPTGPCEVDADESGLTLRVSAADEAALAGLQDVVERHLLRFAFRERLDVRWTRQA